MNWIVESPWPVITLGVVVQVALAIALVRTGRGVYLVVMGAAAAITGAALLAERLIVTEREQVEDALESAAVALEANDPPAFMGLVSPRSPRRAEIEYLLSRVHIRDANVGGDLEIRTNQLTSPPSATAYFTGRVEASDVRQSFPYEHMVQKFKVTLQRHNDRWLIHDYAMADPVGGQWSAARVRVE
jgi:hypothetical protein